MPDHMDLPQPFLTLFPNPATVFREPVDRYFRHLLPLVSIDLTAVDPALHGSVHVVSPIEPYAGVLGEQAPEFWTYYCRENWIGFRLGNDNRYELLSDFRFFEFEGYDESNDAPAKAYAKRLHDAYRLGRERFHKYGSLRPLYSAYDTEPREYSCAILNQLGGPSPEGNWIAGSAIPLDMSDHADIVPVSEHGRRFRLIANASPDSYGQDDGKPEYMRFGADEILLFFEPVERIVLQTFEYD